jgi:hypothetical protein
MEIYAHFSTLRNKSHKRWIYQPYPEPPDPDAQLTKMRSACPSVGFQFTQSPHHPRLKPSSNTPETYFQNLGTDQPDRFPVQRMSPFCTQRGGSFPLLLGKEMGLLVGRMEDFLPSGVVSTCFFVT